MGAGFLGSIAAVPRSSAASPGVTEDVTEIELVPFGPVEGTTHTREEISGTDQAFHLPATHLLHMFAQNSAEQYR